MSYFEDMIETGTVCPECGEEANGDGIITVCANCAEK